MVPEIPINILHVGLGPIGVAAAQLSATSLGLRIVGAVDVNPSLVGMDLRQLVGNAEAKGLTVESRIPLAKRGELNVAIHTTSSSIDRCASQLIELADAGWFVVSSCEELSYPWQCAPETARTIDKAARRAGVVIIGTGINPGYAMDYLPIVLSGTMRRVESVKVLRVQDAGVRRLPLQRKVGAGLTVEEFNERVKQKTVRHVGLLESTQAVAFALGFYRATYSDLIEPIVAQEPTSSGLGVIKPGNVLGVRQVSTAAVAGQNVVQLELQMAIGLKNPRDDISLLGDPPVAISVPGGFHGDTATQAMLINTIVPALQASPGLKVMSEVSPPRPAMSVSLRTGA